MKKRYTILAHVQDKKGHYLSSTCNSYKKSHPLQKFFAEKVGHPHQPFAHAEILCMLRCKDKKIHKLMIFRYGNNGELVCAKPCPICQEAFTAYQPTEVWYSDQGTMVKL